MTGEHRDKGIKGILNCLIISHPDARQQLMKLRINIKEDFNK